MRGTTVNVSELQPQSLRLHGRLIRIKMPHVTTWQKELQQWGNFFVEDLKRFEDRRTPRWFAGQEVIDPVFHSIFLFYFYFIPISLVFLIVIFRYLCMLFSQLSHNEQLLMVVMVYLIKPCCCQMLLQWNIVKSLWLFCFYVLGKIGHDIMW